MNNLPQLETRPKIDNNGIFARYLAEYPPKYKYGDTVYTNKYGWATISGRVFKEKEKTWKYTVCILGRYHFDVENETEIST